MHNHLPFSYIFTDRYNNKIFENNNTNMGVIYRNYNDPKREVQLLKIAKVCKKKKYKLFVSNDIKLALKVGANGIYIPAFNKTKNFHNLEKKNLIVLGSAHNQKEIREKISQKCEAIFLSPIFYTKKSKKFLNIYKFNFLSHMNKVKIMALGGINESNIKKLKLLNVDGFGGIGLFKKKTGHKIWPVF